MQPTLRHVLSQLGHALQMTLFPRLEEELGELTPQLRLLSAVQAMIPLAGVLDTQRAPTGRPPRDRAALASAFIAKAILNLPTTRDLISRLRCDAALRRLCGFAHADAVPDESIFSRAFQQFATTSLPQQFHEAVIRQTQQDRLVGHIARDATAIEARERFPDPPAEGRKKKKKTTTTTKKKKKKKKKKAKSPRKKGEFERAKAAERGTRIQRQRHQKLDVMLATSTPNGVDDVAAPVPRSGLCAPPGSLYRSASG